MKNKVYVAMLIMLLLAKVFGKNDNFNYSLITSIFFYGLMLSIVLKSRSCCIKDKAVKNLLRVAVGLELLIYLAWLVIHNWWLPLIQADWFFVSFMSVDLVMMLMQIRYFKEYQTETDKSLADYNRVKAIAVIVFIVIGVLFSKGEVTAQIWQNSWGNQISFFVYLVILCISLYYLLLIGLSCNVCGNFGMQVLVTVFCYTYFASRMLELTDGLSRRQVHLSLGYQSLIMAGFVCLAGYFLFARDEENKQPAEKKERIKQIKQNSIRYNSLFWVLLLVLGLGWKQVINFGFIIIAVEMLLLLRALDYFTLKNYYYEIQLKSEADIASNLGNEVVNRTMRLKALNDDLYAKSVTDALTGLKNRKYMSDQIDRLIEKSEAGFNLFIIDINRFKIINDIFGYSTGDQVLEIVGARLKALNHGDLCFIRLGGDEFAGIYQTNDLREIRKVGLQIVNAVRTEIIVNQAKFVLDVSVGSARYPHDAYDHKQLMTNATIAMEHAKKSDLFDYAMHSSIFSKSVTRMHELERMIQGIQFDEELEILFQPQVDIMHDKIVGAEVFVRWHYIDGDIIHPSEFIPIAEKNGMIEPITFWIIEKAFSIGKQWQERYDPNFMLSINLSPNNFSSATFIDKLVRIIQDTGITPSNITMEISETGIMTSSVDVERFLKQLAELKVRVSIDHFGIGFSSLSSLKRFSISEVKIAKALIDNIAKNKDDALITRAIIDMTEAMELAVVAEGVESIQQVNILREKGCNVFQGYYFGYELRAEHFEKEYLNR